MIFLVLTSNLSLFAATSWTCSSDSDCPAGTTCDTPSSSCKPEKDKVAEYVTIRLKTGANNPNSFGSGTIFVQNPANDMILGQLEVNGSASSGEYYFIQELSISISAPSSVKFENFRLVYDKNGNGLVDSSEDVISEGSISGFSVKFEVEQKFQGFKTNQLENFLIVASFSDENPIDNLNFYAFIQNNTSIVAKASKGTDIEHFERLSFPKFSFEPKNGYFLFASGSHFAPQTPPRWEEINKEWEIMHLRLKALDDANELQSLTIDIYGSSVRFGNGVEKIALCSDKNNDGKCDDVIVELSEFTEDQESAVFQIPEGKVSLNTGEETFLVVKANLNFYKDQNASFYIKENDITLKTKKKIAGTNIQTVTFNYNCKESDEGCRLKPEENEETEDDSATNEDSGCSILFID